MPNTLLVSRAPERYRLNVEHAAVIRTFVHELVQRRRSGPAPADDEALLAGGRLDSVDVLEIVAFLEERFGVDFRERPFDLDDFETIAAIAALATRDA